MAEEFFLASQAWGVASALAVTAIGAISLLGGRSRPRGALAFGLFCITWGFQIALGNLVLVAADTRTAAMLYGMFLAFASPVTFFLIEFAVSQVPPARYHFGWTLARILAIGIASGAALLLIFSPELFFTTSEGIIVRGALIAPLVVWPQFMAFGAALVALFISSRAAPTPRTALRATTLLAGIGVYVGFTAGYYTGFYSLSLALYPVTNMTYVVIFYGLAVLTTTIGIRLWWAAQRARTPAEGRRDRLVALAILAPFVWGIIESTINVTSAPGLLTVGVWRIIGVGILTYGLARWRLFDLPQRAVRTAATAAGASGSIATGAAAFGVGTLLTTGIALPTLAGLVVVGATFIPGIKTARRILARLTSGEETEAADYLYGQRVDAYRAALENAYARHTLEEDSEFLGALREKWGINEGEDRLLRYYARSAVLVPREGDASAVFERLRLLGEGGAGRTWLARDRVRDRLVVLKEPLANWQREPSVRESVLREARMAARVRHPNVISVEEIIEEKGMPIIVMEFMDGGSLSDHLRRTGILGWRDAAEFTINMLRGVEAIHANGIIHRDLKPSNVLLNAAGQPKVADFGIAVPANASKTVVDGSTTFAGTYAYVAPEVRLGAVGDRRSDIYSCAAILHECLHGSPPGPRAPVIAHNQVPLAISSLLSRALSHDPAQRPTTARAFADELLSVIRK